MGGIVAAETVMALTSDQPIPSSDGGMATQPALAEQLDKPESNSDLHFNSLMFPYIQGVLALDTPYLGIAPSVIAFGAEGQVSAASQAVAQLSGLAGLWGGGSSGGSSKAPADSLPAPTSTSSATPPGNKKTDGPGGWGKFAAFAGAGMALAGAGAAAYLGREHIVAAGNWVGSHLEFVNTLAKAAELRRRVTYMARASQELNIGFANLYTALGRGTNNESIWTVDGSPLKGMVAVTGEGAKRTFCNLPNGKEPSGLWREEINDAAGDEAQAHMTMFDSTKNPGYRNLTIDAKSLIVNWTRNEWYESST